MTPAERAKEIVSLWVDADGTCGPRSRDCLIEELASALTVPANHVRDEHGNDLRVLGTLPKTADGCVVAHNNVPVYHCDDTGQVHCFSYRHVNANRHVWYSSREAALAAKNGGGE